MSYNITTSFVGLGFSIAAQPPVELEHASPAPCAPVAPAAFVGLGFEIGLQSSVQHEQVSACPAIQSGPPPYPFPRRRNPEKLNAPSRHAFAPPFPFPRRRKDLLQTPDVEYTRADPRRALGLGSPPRQFARAMHAL